MADLFSTFIETPSGDNFSSLRESLISQPEYDFYSEDLDDLEDLVADENYPAVLARVADLMPNWLLSPRVHQLIGAAAAETGDQEMMEREAYLMNACLKGLLESGDGSRERPYRITHTSDEYDVVEALGKDISEQRTDTEGETLLDVLVCDDGTELHFDISPSVQPSL